MADSICVLIKDSRERTRYHPISSAVSGNDLSNLKMLKVASGALTAGALNTFAFAWQNPETANIIVRDVIINISTAATAAATLSVDVVATAITVPGTNIYGTLPLNVQRCYSSHNVTDTGAGIEKPVVVNAAGGANSWVVGYEDSGAQAMTGMVAVYYIFYQEVR